MKRQITVLLALVASVGIGTAAQAQAKKAFVVGEVEILDKAGYEALTKITGPEIQKSGGQPLNTTLGKIVPISGEAPKAVILVQWDSLEKAEAYLNSAEFKSHEAQRDKAYKATRAFIVEAGPEFTGFTQGPKKAYWIRDLEVINQAALNSPPASPSPALQEINRQTGRQATATANGKVVARVGEAPKRFALQGFSSLEQAQTFIKSPLNTPLQSFKTIREYIVEAAQ